jgi:hypothetical protein
MAKPDDIGHAEIAESDALKGLEWALRDYRGMLEKVRAGGSLGQSITADYVRGRANGLTRQPKMPGLERIEAARGELVASLRELAELLDVDPRPGRCRLAAAVPPSARRPGSGPCPRRGPRRPSAGVLGWRHFPKESARRGGARDRSGPHRSGAGGHPGRRG